MRPNPKPIRLINQQIDPLPPLQNPLDILRHDAPHILNLPLHVADRVLFAPFRGPVTDHQLFQPGIEIRGAVGRQAGEIRRLRVVARKELFLDFDEVAEGYAPPETAGGDDEIREAAGAGVCGGVVGGGIGDVVDEVLVVGVG